MDPSTKLLANCLLTLMSFLLASLLLYAAILIVWGSSDFAGFITGIGSIAIVLGVNHGFVQLWRRRRGVLGAELSHGRDLCHRTSMAGWGLAILSFCGLVVIRPDEQAVWLFGLVWGGLGGIALALAFRAIRAELDDMESADL